MAEKLVIELDLEKGDVKGATSSLEKSAKKSGEKSGKLFSKEFNDNVAGRVKAIGSVAAKASAVVAGLATALGTVFTFKTIAAAQAQEDAINNLNNALKTSGDFTVAASESFQQFASDLQSVTRFGDELILNQIALAKSFGATNEQAKQIVSAATDLSAAFGIDIESATRNVAKTLGGLAGELGETIPQLKELGVEGLRAGKGIEFIAQRFSGAAQRDVNTYSGAVDQLSNAFGDVSESIGRIITKNPQLIQAIKSVTVILGEATKGIDDFAKNFNLFNKATETFINFNDAFITYVIAPFEQLFNITNILQQTLNAAFARIISGVGNVGLGIAKVLEGLGIGDKLSQGLLDFEQTSEIVANETEQKFVNAFKNISDFSLSDGLAKKNEELRTFFSEQSAIAQEAALVNQEVLNTSNQSATQSLMTWKDAFVDAFTIASDKSMSLQDQIKKTNDKMKKFADDTAKNLRNGLAVGAGQAFAAFGKAIATGENALDSFAKALFKSIADQAVALGTNFVLTGTAMLFSPNPKDQAQAPFLIKSGAALAAFGGFLGGLAGGGGGTATAGNTGIGEGNIPVTNDIANPEDEQERLAPQTNVEVVVQGSLVQQEELGDFITRTLNESFAKQGVTLTDARFA